MPRTPNGATHKESLYLRCGTSLRPLRLLVFWCVWVCFFFVSLSIAMPSMTEITKGLTPQKLLSGVQPESKRSDMAKILSIFKKHSKEIHVYGGSIIGAGKMLYQSKSQKPYNWFQCGVAARASNITMYFGCLVAQWYPFAIFVGSRFPYKVTNPKRGIRINYNNYAEP